MPTRQRKVSYVDNNVQGALARRLILHWAIFIVVACALTFVFQWLQDPFKGFAGLMQDVWRVQGPFLLVAIMLIPVFVYDSITMSGRFAGPVHRLRQTICEIADDGKVREVGFREGDFWNEVAVDFNRMVKRISESRGEAVLLDANATSGQGENVDEAEVEV